MEYLQDYNRIYGAFYFDVVRGRESQIDDPIDT